MRRVGWASSARAAVAITAAVVGVAGCSDTEQVVGYAPVYLSYAELRAPVAASDPVELEETGKIYVKDSYIYVNERFKGIHVIDNTNPSSPLRIARICGPSCSGPHLWNLTMVAITVTRRSRS